MNPTVEASGLDTQVNVPYGCYADGEASLAVRKELADGPGERFVGRLYALLQHPRQQQAADQRSLCRTQAGFRRSRRRREFHQNVGGSARHTTKSSTTSSASSSCRPAISPAGAAKNCACSTTSRWGRNWCAALRQRAFGPRDLTIGTTNDPLGGIALLGCERGSSDAACISCQRISASRLRLLRTPARYGIIKARQAGA